MNQEELKDQAIVLQRDLKVLKAIHHPLYDYELYRAAKWLREEAGWFVAVYLCAYTGEYELSIYRTNAEEFIHPDNEHDIVIKDYEEALEAAVETALTHIIKQQ